MSRTEEFVRFANSIEGAARGNALEYMDRFIPWKPAPTIGIAGNLEP